MRFLLFMLPTVLTSSFLFLAFLWVGICQMSDCLGSGQASVTNVFIGLGVIAVAAIPFGIVGSVFYQFLKGKPIKHWQVIAGWALVVTIGALGLFQIAMDPGDAVWAGLPMLVLCGCFGLSILTYPYPN